MIRPAKFGDIPRLLALLHEMHARSVYRDRDEIDDREAKSILMSAIQNDGGGAQSRTRVLVAERDGTVEGFIVGVTERVYHIGRRYWATDLWFYVSGRGGPRDAPELRDGFLAWADGNPHVIDIKPAVTNAIVDDRRAGRLWERRGFVRCGSIYSREKAPCPES